MKRLLFLIGTFVITITIFQSCNSTPNQTVLKDSATSNETVMNTETEIELGHHLVATAGCGDCHTPKKMTDRGPEDDSSLLLSGHPHNMPAPKIAAAEIANGIAATNTQTAWVGPWGTSYSANLTPDSTGILGWNEAQFMKCLQQGLFKGLDGSRPLMPPMPVESVRNYSGKELKAMFAYLKSINPIHNIVPEYAPPGNMK